MGRARVKMGGGGEGGGLLSVFYRLDKGNLISVYLYPRLYCHGNIDIVFGFGVNPK